MNEEPNGTMLSLVSSALRCRVTEKLTVRMPRVVSDQRAKFENDELFRKLSRESEVRYTGFRDRPHDERQLRFHTECREGHADVAFTATGTNLQLSFAANAWSDKPEDRTPTQEFVNFDREPGKVHLKSQFIMNGVCVVWRGWIDLQRLDGIGCLEFDDDRAEVEDAILREQIDQYNRRLREFEERQRQYRQDQERQAESEAEQERQMLVRLETGDYYQTPSSQNGFPRHRTQRSEKDYRIRTKADSRIEVPIRAPQKRAAVIDAQRSPWKPSLYIL
ncbi:core-binding factor subunit beta-like isoform X1 [Haliotis cracherodii]|uniref:core-binding factor subunit beta-like isoform X1 n=1 Tax=Haliotis rufescens TaxID=6454 RepID=UPI001EAF9CC4|nr:core-binding factor subunit beta-like isoform X1 [Haliotis rufescens]